MAGEAGGFHLGAEGGEAGVAVEFDGDRFGEVAAEGAAAGDVVLGVGGGAEAAARFEDAEGFAEGGGAVGDVMDDVDGVDEVEAGGGEIERFGAALGKGDLIGALAGGGEHLGGGVNTGAAATEIVVEGGDVVTGAAADFEDGGAWGEVAGGDQVGEDAGVNAAVAGVVGSESVVVETRDGSRESRAKDV